MAASANEVELEIISAAVDHNFKLQAEKMLGAKTEGCISGRCWQADPCLAVILSMWWVVSQADCVATMVTKDT